MRKNDIKKFQKLIWDFYKKNKRNFPWRNTTDPYGILVSEIMLQQTQADRVVGYYTKWLKRFPNFKSLAQATFSEIYPYWQGLGYNRRALALQKTAQKTMEEFGGKLPKNIEVLEEFPGIGPYTARAVAIFAYQAKIACIETNIRRVFIHEFFPTPLESQTYADSTQTNADQRRRRVSAGQRILPSKIDDKQILKLAEQALDQENSREWHYALMDYGAYLKTQVPNPNHRAKNYSVQSKFEGSVRQIRGSILRSLAKRQMSLLELAKINPPQKSAESNAKLRGKLKTILDVMEKEGLIEQSKKVYSLK